jgi:hypothetical protein
MVVVSPEPPLEVAGSDIYITTFNLLRLQLLLSTYARVAVQLCSHRAGVFQTSELTSCALSARQATAMVAIHSIGVNTSGGRFLTQ